MKIQELVENGPLKGTNMSIQRRDAPDLSDPFRGKISAPGFVRAAVYNKHKKSKEFHELDSVKDQWDFLYRTDKNLNNSNIIINSPDGKQRYTRVSYDPTSGTIELASRGQRYSGNVNDFLYKGRHRTVSSSTLKYTFTVDPNQLKHLGRDPNYRPQTRPKEKQKVFTVPRNPWG
jgi:hypothetical protein